MVSRQFFFDTLIKMCGKKCTGNYPLWKFFNGSSHGVVGEAEKVCVEKKKLRCYYHEVTRDPGEEITIFP